MRVAKGQFGRSGRLLFDRLIRPMIFSDLGPCRLKHHVEEVGNLYAAGGG
jgi:hypothetical protein